MYTFNCFFIQTRFIGETTFTKRANKSYNNVHNNIKKYAQKYQCI